MTVAYPRKLRNQLSAQDILNQVVRIRDIHLVTLNRYRYNEQRSCKDLTNLIEQLNGQPRDLVQDLSHHVADEARHAQWLTDLLADLGGPLDTPPGVSYIDEFERLIDANPEDTIIEALAAINVTEKRGCEYFSAHLKALKAMIADPDTPADLKQEQAQVAEVIGRILPEEAAHVRWGSRRLATIARQSEAHRQKVEQARQKYVAIEQAAYESGMDILAGAEFRRLSNLMKVAETLPLWQRPGYVLERLPQTLLDPKLQVSRLQAAQRAWSRDPKAFMEQFIPMFLGGLRDQLPRPAKAGSQN
ncbi:MAG: ferritin-like domain-containing protein [Thermostichales cyanobacterium SZTDM-1c_bins_54]